MRQQHHTRGRQMQTKSLPELSHMSGADLRFFFPNQMFHQASAVRTQGSPSIRRQAGLRVSPSVGPGPSTPVRLTGGRNESHTLSCPCGTQVMGVCSASVQLIQRLRKRTTTARRVLHSGFTVTPLLCLLSRRRMGPGITEAVYLPGCGWEWELPPMLRVGNPEKPATDMFLNPSLSIISFVTAFEHLNIMTWGTFWCCGENGVLGAQ